MEIEKINFVLELTKKQLEFVRSSTDKNANLIALGLFGNESFVEILVEVSNIDFMFHTKQGWAIDDKPALIFDLESIISLIEEKINTNN